MSKREVIVAEYDYYTLDQAKELLYAEMRHNRIIRRCMEKQRARRKKRERIYRVKQCLSGLVLVSIGLIMMSYMHEDATLSLFTVPLGLYLIFTKKKVMVFKENNISRSDK